jgi:di/tricarboxylate transporter
MADHRFLPEDAPEGGGGRPGQVAFTVVVLVVMFAVLITDRVGTDSVMLTALTAFYISAIIDVKEALAGFSSQGLLTVLALFVVAEGLNKTGALNWYVARLLGRPRTASGAQLRVMVPVAALSGFVNDTPLVTVTLPVVVQWARKINLPARFLLVPLSFAALLGGVCTLIGTSTNLVVAGLLQENYPDDPQLQNMGLFELGRYGVPVAFLGIAYVILATPLLLARGQQHQTNMHFDTEDLLLGARLTQWSPAAGRTIQRSGLRDTGGIYLVRVKRQATGNLHHAVGPEFVLQVGDILYFTGLVESFGDFCAEHGLEVVTNEVQDPDTPVTTEESRETEPLLLREEAAPARIGTTLDSLLRASPPERMRAVYRVQDAIRGEDFQSPAWSEEVRVVVTMDQDDLVVIAIDCPDRSGLLLDVSKCLARLQLEHRHTEAAVRHYRSLSIWRCESSNHSDEFLSEIWSVVQALLTKDTGVEAVKQRGLRVIRARVLKGRLVGSEAAHVDFRKTYKAAIVAVQRDGKSLTEPYTMMFAEGDILILQAADDSPLLQSPPEDFYDEVTPENMTGHRRSSLTARLFGPLRSGTNDSPHPEPGNENLDSAEMGQVEESEEEKEAAWRDLRVMTTDDAYGGLASREFLTAMKVESSQLVGKTVAQAGIDKLPDLFLVSVERPVAIPDIGTEISSYAAVALSEPLEAGDVLWFSGTAASVGDLRKIPGLVSYESEEVNKLNEKIYNRRLVEAVVARRGPLVGKTVKEVRFRTQYGAAVIAVQREGQRVHEHPGNVKLHAGDVLLCEAGPSFASNKVQHDRSFALVAEVEDSAPPRLRMLIPAIVITAGAYGCFMAKLSSLWGCAMVAGILMVMLGIMSESEARNAIQWEIFLTIASAYGIGSALVNSGVAAAVASFLVKVGNAIGLGDAGLLGAVYLSTVLISQLVANNAAAALIFPIAMGAAESTGTDLKLMSYTIMLAASAAFMTPLDREEGRASK